MGLHTCLVSGGGCGTGDAAALSATVGQDRVALEAMLELIRHDFSRKCVPPLS